MPSGNIAHLSHAIVFSLMNSNYQNIKHMRKLSLNTRQHSCKEK